MRRNQTTHVSAGFTWEPQDHLGSIPASYDFSCHATLTPYNPGDHTEPPSGATCEFTSVHLTAVHTEDRVYPAGGEPRRAELEAEFMQWLHQPAQVFVLKNLETEMFQEAHEQDEAAREEAAEQRAEHRREREEESRANAIGPMGFED